jgi:tRNA A-37 threonylcarbamoyl transferase component Bud32
LGEDSGNRSLDALLREIARAPDAAVPSLLVGETLGRYRLDALLGRGGMGVVYRARDTKLDRDVALKLLPPELVGDKERRARFVREAKLTAQVTHPCVAAVYDVGEQDDAVFLAMELVTGRTLRAVLEEHPKGMPAADVARIGADLARGLAKAHAAGIVHRDLKPENVMLDDEGHPKILDFGLAKLREVEGADPEALSTELGRVLGTPSYMSPEQAKGKPVDARSDVFSLGIVLYEMLAAKRPFVGETTMEVLIAIDRDAPPPLAEVREGLPAPLAELVATCLDKDPRARPDARTVATKLRALATGEAATAPAARPSRRRLLAVVAIALVAAIAVAAPLRRRAQTNAARMPAAPPLDAAFPKDGVALACPPLEATSGNARAGWMGAAAASFICERAAVMLGGVDSSTLVPAELLDLPRAPSEDLAADVYADPATRERAVTAAKTRAPTWLDGRVDLTSDVFHVAFVVRGRDGTEIARGSAADAAFNHAVTRAMDAAGFPIRPLDADLGRFALTPDPQLDLLAGDALAGILYGTPEDRDRLAAHGAALGPAWPAIQITAARTFAEPKPDVQPWPLDRSTPERLGLTASLRSSITNDVPLSVADELHALAEKERSRQGRAAYALAEASIRAPAGQTERVRDMLLALVK